MMTAFKDTWAEAYAQHHHTVVLALLANGARLDEARELAHDAWARIYEQHETAKITTVEWPGLIIRQACFLLAESRRRAVQRAARDTAVDHATTLADVRSSPEDTVAGRELLGAVNEALATASPRERAVLTAVMTRPDAQHAELAQREGVSLQRFRQILCEVRAHLRSALGRATQ